MSTRRTTNRRAIPRDLVGQVITNATLSLAIDRTPRHTGVTG